MQVQTIIAGLEHPWGLASLPDGRFLVTESNPGHLRIGSPDGELSAPLERVPEIFRYEGDTERSQGGLFDVAPHPEFEQNQLVDLSVAMPSERGAGTAIVRGRLVEEGQEVTGEEWMLDMERRIRDVKVADDGSIWLLTEHEDGEVLRLTPIS